jgi:hypothetical protein
MGAFQEESEKKMADFLLKSTPRQFRPKWWFRFTCLGLGLLGHRSLGLSNTTIMVAKNKKKIKGALGRRLHKTAPQATNHQGHGNCAADETTAELDRLVKEKIVTANNNKKYMKAKTALDNTPRASNSKKHIWNDARSDGDDDGEYSASEDESRYDSVLDGNKSHDSDDSSNSGGRLSRCGSSWYDEDQQENAFFEKSGKVETHQAVVKVLEHGNTQMLVLEVSILYSYHCMLLFSASRSFLLTSYYSCVQIPIFSCVAG